MGSRQYGLGELPKTPSISAVWRMLEQDYGVTRPDVRSRIKTGETAEIGDYNPKRRAFPVWVHVAGAAYPEQYWFDQPEAAHGQG